MRLRRSRHASSPKADGRGDLFAVLDALREVNQSLRIADRAVEQRLGISGAQLFVLEQLKAAPVSSLNELAARTFTRHSSVSVVVSRLVDAGLVERRSSELDARRITLDLTRAGRSLLRSAPESGQNRLVASARRLSTSQLKQLAAGLARLSQELAPEAVV
jgi:DNA-binding MarR family transcriptional regulator